MKATGYRQSLPIDQPGALEDLELPPPVPRPRDLVVRVAAVSVNPVDTKVRKNRSPSADRPEILGWDAVGVVEARGAEATRFAVGDRVYYAGAIDRPGTNSELHAVDERIVALAPRTASDAEAAALPLTSITAYELLFDRLGIAKDGGDGKTLLVIGGAGGVGSILIQLARQLTHLRVVATASRPETRQWCLELGAHAVVGHDLEEIARSSVDYVASLTETAQHYERIIDRLKPQGALGLIDDMEGLDVMALKNKSLSLHWELMFTRSLHQTEDMAEQGRLLGEVAELVDAGRLRTTASTVLKGIDAANLIEAHRLVESGKTRGKIVLEVK